MLRKKLPDFVHIRKADPEWKRKSLPCQTPGCEGTLRGRFDQLQAWVNVYKERAASVKRFGKCLCHQCQTYELIRRGELKPSIAKDPNEQARELLEFLGLGPTPNDVTLPNGVRITKVARRED